MSLDYREIVMKGLLIPADQMGLISPQDVWGLELPRLRKLYKSYYSILKETDTEDQMLAELELDSEISESPELQLNKIRFELIKDAYKTKLEAKKFAKSKAERDAKVKQLKTIMFQNQQKALMEKSPEELETMIKELEAQA